MFSPTLFIFLQYFGGTNFGRTAGGPLVATSYDYDAPINEYGKHSYLDLWFLTSYNGAMFSVHAWIFFRVSCNRMKLQLCSL